MTRIIISLRVFGIICLLSAISGIASLMTTKGGNTITYYQSYLSRGCVMLLGCCLFCLAWAVSQRRLMAWRAMFFVHAAAWMSFVLGGAYIVGKQYPRESTRDTLLFAGILAIVSSPVAIKLGRDWWKQKRYFDGESNDAD